MLVVKPNLEQVINLPKEQTWEMTISTTLIFNSVYVTRLQFFPNGHEDDCTTIAEFKTSDEDIGYIYAMRCADKIVAAFKRDCDCVVLDPERDAKEEVKR